MEALFFKRPERRPLTPPRSCYVSSVFRNVPLCETTAEKKAARIAEIIQRRRQHRENGDIDDLTHPKKQPQKGTVETKNNPVLPGFSPDMFKTAEEIELEKWRPIFNEAWKKMANDRKIENAVKLYCAASTALIAVLNETTAAAEDVLQHRREAPSSLIDETKERLIGLARVFQRGYQDNVSDLYDALDGFFDLVERLEDNGDLVLTSDDAAQYLGINPTALSGLVRKGLLHPITNRQKGKRGGFVRVFTIPDLDNAVRLLAKQGKK